jgi:NAD(P)-dependent dehydrogenase (short-subunit alcohol dehydrogenase family)
MAASEETPAAAGLAGSVAIVTGAAGGVGREVVRLLVGAGADVVAEDLVPAVTGVESGAGRVASLCGDAALADTARAAVALALDRFGKLDILINNAARFLGKPVLETTDEEWDGLMATNVRSVFVHCREALPHLLESGIGAIVNMSSISGVVGLSDQAAYCTTKGAIAQLTRQLAVDYSGRGVRVNAVAPGAIDTPFLKGALSGAPDLGEAMEEVAAVHLLGRIATPAEIAEVVVFLASPRASFMTGAVVMADGGYTAR